MLAQSSQGLSFPIIISKLFQVEGSTPWNFYFYQEFQNILLNQKSDEFCDEVKKYFTPLIKNASGAQRIQVDFQGGYLLVAFLPQQKEVRFYTARLSHELFIIQECTGLNLTEEANQKFLELKKHTEQVASLAGKEFPSIYRVLTEKLNLSHVENLPEKEEIQRKFNIHLENLLSKMHAYRPTLFERISDMGLNLTATYALLRIHLLKFLAILPSLDHDKEGHEVKRILLEALRRLIWDSQKSSFLGKKGQDRPLPGYLFWPVRFFSIFCKWLPAGLLTWIVRSGVKLMAKRFIAGENIEVANAGLKILTATNRNATLDQLGELVVSEKEADHYCHEVVKIIRGLGQHIKKGERNGAGILKAHVSIKVSALCAHFVPEDFEATYKQISPRLRDILTVAKREQVFINIDAEHYHYRDTVFEVYKKVLLETNELSDYADTGIVLQAYLRDCYTHYQKILELARIRKHCMPVRLVKGAYWDAETVEATAHGFNAPQFLNKEETDLHYRQMIVEIFKSYPHIQLCLAGHNYADHCFAVALKETSFKDLPAIEHQCLHMTYEGLSVGMAQVGWVVRNYVPIGGLLVGMAYLVRRIMENSSQVGVLTIMRSHKRKGSLTPPDRVHAQKCEQGTLERDRGASILTHEFFNQAPMRLYLEKHLEAFSKSFEQVRKTLGAAQPNTNNLTGEEVTIRSNSDENLIVGKITFADTTDVDKIVTLAHTTYNSGIWAKATWQARASCLLKASRIMLARRSELASLIIFEAGKSTKEALGDVDEAIDFLVYYATQEARLAKYDDVAPSLGVIAVVAPWNFPLAIPCGMVSVALVAGNSVILKSAEQTPLIANLLVDILHEAGIGKDVLIHLPGQGETVGDALIKDERIAGVVFTGSKSVGNYLHKTLTGRIVNNQLFNLKFPAKVITEMGGKNAIIVTANAELDETVSGILYSSFAHAGQKCSACSRVLVHYSVKDKLIQRLGEACRDLKIDSAWELSTFINPLVNSEEKKRLQAQVKEATLEVEQNGGRVVIDRSQESFPGACMGPVVFDIPAAIAKNSNSYAKRELFGPVVHVVAYNSLDEALELFNGTEYGLTGGVFSQSQDDIDYLTQKMECGNIYVNRPITGARVGIEPFGGFKLSGTGPKAGGNSYISGFHVRKVNLPALEELQRSMPADEKGEVYAFDLCRPSKLGLEKRLARFDRGLEVLINNFEYLFQGIYGENKKLLADFRRWMKRDGQELLLKDQANVTIPGQLSFDRWDMIKKNLLVCAHEERAHFSSLLYVLCALASGVGVTVAARNQKAFQFWSTLNRFFVQNGFSRENFDVWFSSKEYLETMLAHNELELICIDANIEKVSMHMKSVMKEEKYLYHVKQFLTPFDAPQIKHFKAYMYPCIKVRSFAINTMRHGAPLEIEL